jgi:hypothetical protein
MEINDQDVRAAVGRFRTAEARGVLTKIMAFGRALKALGLKTSLSQILDSCRSIQFVDIGDRSTLRVVLRANLVSRREEIELFDRVFDLFWDEGDDFSTKPAADIEIPAPAAGEENADEGGEGPSGDGAEEIETADGRDDEEKTPSSVSIYSPQAVLGRKDFSEMSLEEHRAVSEAILLIANKIATRMSRRKKRALRGAQFDHRHTLRRNMKYGGEIIELVPRRRRIKKTRVVLLCDVSGSMDCYSRFLIQFMYGLQNELWGVETFVFSTALSRITHLIRTHDIGVALERISESVVGWSGGTDIGGSLKTFNGDFASRLVTPRTVVVIISDGWDRGDTAVLEREMIGLKRRCFKIIWLNPLLSSDNYRPLCKGMQAALPHVDFFLSVHNLNSLRALGRTLQRLAA